MWMDFYIVALNVMQCVVILIDRCWS